MIDVRQHGRLLLALLAPALVMFGCALVEEQEPVPPVPVAAPAPVPGAGCSSSFADVSKPLCDGTYTQSVTPSTFPAGSLISAQNPGMVTFTGSFRPGENLTFRGIVVRNSGEKQLASNGTYEDMSFVGGPPCGNTVNTMAANGVKNVIVRRSAFYGKGGRYLLLVYQSSGVKVEDSVFRPDGGWNEDCSGKVEPNAGLAFYNSNDVSCAGCVLIDGLKPPGSEHLGGLGVNCHVSARNAVFDRSVIVNSPRGFFAEGNGTCDSVKIKSSVAAGGDYASNRNVSGETAIVGSTLIGNCGGWKGSTTLTGSRVTGSVSGCSGSKVGAGAELRLNTRFLDDPRWRRELCATESRGFCSTKGTLSGYLMLHIH
ncbi:MAG: hypothetical protein OEV81_08305 [Betaproteobacteria bacterium]|nr:hypothetical protein [Betaproteobacteria bacterium]MDH5349560.1 hypothetical protein [Betaproteobacteria bacterium]